MHVNKCVSECDMHLGVEGNLKPLCRKFVPIFEVLKCWYGRVGTSIVVERLSLSRRVYYQPPL